MADISLIREEINNIDDKLIELLAKRKELYKNIAQFKFTQGKPIKDTERETMHLKHLIAKANTQGLSADFISTIYQTIFEHSCSLQQSYMLSLIATNAPTSPQVKVAFLGEQGTYSYLATYKYFKNIASKIIEKNCTSFNEIIASVENNEVDYALLPIENSSSGCINEVYDLLQDTTSKIIGELTYPVEHCLLAKDNYDLANIEAICAHPQPISQCSNFIHQNLPNVKLIPCSSSSEALQKVKALDNANIVAIGCKEAGELYGLKPIAGNIANQKANTTRFIVISNSPVSVPKDITAKTSITFTTENKPGALVNVLKLFSEHNINIVKLQSRPRSPLDQNHGLWAETFYADLIANTATPQLTNVFSKLKMVTGSVKVLGCYPQNVEI